LFGAWLAIFGGGAISTTIAALIILNLLARLVLTVRRALASSHTELIEALKKAEREDYRRAIS